MLSLDLESRFFLNKKKRKNTKTNYIFFFIFEKIELKKFEKSLY